MMKRILLGLLLSTAPPWIVSTYAEDADVGVVRKGNCVVAVAGEDGEPITTEITLAGCEEGARAYAFVSTDVDVTEDGRSEGTKAIVRVKRFGSAGDAKGGWLGVSIATVSEALATQLGTEGRGILVQNVVADSPADQADLQVHDIILAIDGQDVGEDLGHAVGLIKEHEPGEVVNIMVLRNGVTMPISVTLGSRADLGGPRFEWKYETGPNAVIEDAIKTRGKIMLKGPNGEWTVKDLGDLDEIEGLPADIRAFIPKSGTRTIQIQALDGDETIHIEVQRDGTTIAIEQEDGGPITVERTDAAGNESTVTYETAEELEESDAEAYELYSHTGGAHAFTFKLDGIDDLENVFEFDMDLEFDKGEFEEHIAEWHAQLEESLGAARDAYGHSMEEANRMLEELQNQGWMDDHGQHHPLPLLGKDGEHVFVRPFGLMAKPKHSFELRADGSIEVRIRKGDSELVQIYANEQDLQQRAPDLFDKFDDLMSLNDE